MTIWEFARPAVSRKDPRTTRSRDGKAIGVAVLELTLILYSESRVLPNDNSCGLENFVD